MPSLVGISMQIWVVNLDILFKEYGEGDRGKEAVFYRTGSAEESVQVQAQ